MKARTIVVVLDRFDPLYGGLESWADRWTRWLAGRGHDVHVAAFAIAPDSAGPGVIPHVLPAASGRLARAAEVEKFLRRMDPDIVHDLGVGWRYDILQPQAGSRLANARQDLLSLGGPARLKRRLSPWHIRRDREFRALEKRQFGPGRGIVIAVSRMVQDDLRRRYGLDPGRIRLVYNGVDQRQTGRPGRPQVPGRPPELSGASATKPCFCSSAHNFRLKGLGPSLKALSVLKRAGRSCHLAIVGRGPREEYQALARRLGVSDRVSFHGQVRDVRPFFNGADVFVLPTFHDACSLVVGEAWASGLPVITSRFNGAAELMTSGVHGWIIDDPRDARELARRMESLLDPGPREDDVCGRPRARLRTFSGEKLRPDRGDHRRSASGRGGLEPGMPDLNARRLLALAHTAGDPAARFRIGQYIPYLERAGWRVSLRTNRPARPWQSPVRNPALRAVHQRLGVWRRRVNRLRDLRSAADFDVVFLNRDVLESDIRYERYLLRRNPRLIFDFDDAIFLDGKEAHAAWVCRRAAWVTAGNADLADFARRFTDRVTVLPTVIDTDAYAQAGVRPAGGPFRVGWCGSDSFDPPNALPPSRPAGPPPAEARIRVRDHDPAQAAAPGDPAPLDIRGVERGQGDAAGVVLRRRDHALDLGRVSALQVRLQAPPIYGFGAPLGGFPRRDQCPADREGATAVSWPRPRTSGPGP